MVLMEANFLVTHARGILSMPLTILVVDDDLGTRLSISDYLELSGYSVIVANDGQEALAMVEEYHTDLIVTDIVMPQINGYELVRRVRQKHRVPFITCHFVNSTNKDSRKNSRLPVWVRFVLT